MNDWQRATLDFHEKFGAAIGDRPNLDHAETRAKLIMEEAVETVAALGFDVHASIEKRGVIGETAHREVGRFHGEANASLVEAIDGLCDLLYVVAGAAVTMGIDLDPFFEEVHRTNMAKDGGGTRADGKILKPAGWQPPDIAGLLDRLYGTTEAQPGETVADQPTKNGWNYGA